MNRWAGLRRLQGPDWERHPDMGSPATQGPQVHVPAPRVSSAGPPAHAGLELCHWEGLWLSPEERRWPRGSGMEGGALSLGLIHF